MRTKTINLSSAGLKNVFPIANQDEEFEFIFGDQKICLNPIFAEFISPKISRMLKSDPIMNKIDFTDQIKDICVTEEVLSLFKLLAQGYSVDITESQIIQAEIISILLDNLEIFTQVNDIYDENVNYTNIDQYISNIKFYKQIPSSFNFMKYSKIIKYISSNFYRIEENKLLTIPAKILFSIIFDENLVIESEDSLFDFINKLFSEEKVNDDEEINIISFYEEIDFTKLSQSKFEEFVSCFIGSEMTRNLWEKLSKCFYFNYTSNKEKKNEGRYSFKGKKIEDDDNSTNQFSGIIKKFEYDGNSSNQFSGIINFLTEKCGGNVSDKGIVKVTSLSETTSLAKNVVDLQNNRNYFQSRNQQNTWLQYDFIENRIIPTHYSIRTRHDYDMDHPRNWVIEGSNTGGNNENEWVILDSRQNDTELNGKNVSYTFDIEPTQGNEKGFRYLRIRQTGVESSNGNWLTFSALEYFGIFIENKSK